MGAFLNAQMAGRIAEAPVLTSATSSRGLLNDLLDPAARGALSPDVVVALRDALAGALHNLYLVSCLGALVGLVIALLFFPRGSVEDHAGEARPETDAV